jgi:spastin
MLSFFQSVFGGGDDSSGGGGGGGGGGGDNAAAAATTAQPPPPKRQRLQNQQRKTQKKPTAPAAAAAMMKRTSAQRHESVRRNLIAQRRTEGLRLLDVARRHEADAKHQGSVPSKALESYLAALDVLMHAMKLETRAAEKDSLRAVIVSTMDKAEELKLLQPKKKKQQPQKKKSLWQTAAAPKTKRKPSAAAASTSIPSALRSKVESEIIAPGDIALRFADVIGMQAVKTALNEMVLLPAQRPDLFSGIRAPPTGLLMYGPPGNGKTMLATAVAAECKATFFNVSCSSLVSKFHGDSEKVVKALFAIARERAPSIIFIDEIDSLLGARNQSGEHEASRRLKTQIMVEIDGVASKLSTARVVVIGATNCPEDLDDAVIRRLTQRIFVGPPDAKARAVLIARLLRDVKTNLSAAAVQSVAKKTDGFSNSDIQALVKDASMGPLRDMSSNALLAVQASAVSPVAMKHFNEALKRQRPSVSKKRLLEYQTWAKQH